MLGGGNRIGLNRGANAFIPLRGQQDGSLVISEFHYHDPPPSFGSAYFWFYWYVELYNNHDYPLAPGKTVVIAEQAIDHSEFLPGPPDLGDADFQFAWPTRAQNSAVPLMLPIQISTGILQTLFYPNPEVAFVAMPVDVASLERMRGRYQGDFGLFPKAVLLDLAVLNPTNDVGPPSVAPYCRTIVDPSLDPLAAFVRPSWSYQGDSTLLVSAQRKLLPNGHLQRTGTSAVDWEIRARSPGKVP